MLTLFLSCNFDGSSFSCPSFSVNPLLRQNRKTSTVAATFSPCSVQGPSNVRFHIRLVTSVPLVALSPASSVSFNASAYRITASWNAPTKLFTWKQTRHVTGHAPAVTSLHLGAMIITPRPDQTLLAWKSTEVCYNVLYRSVRNETPFRMTTD